MSHISHILFLYFWVFHLQLHVFKAPAAAPPGDSWPSWSHAAGAWDGWAIAWAQAEAVPGPLFVALSHALSGARSDDRFLDHFGCPRDSD